MGCGSRLEAVRCRGECRAVHWLEAPARDHPAPLLAWGPAILMQLAHPLVAQGIADHSAFRKERHGRLRRLFHTIDAMLQISFGTDEQAQAVVARINAIHNRVNGQLSQGAGVFPGGTPYSAHDPALLAWVHA